MDFSLFYFADEGLATQDRYRLLLDGARFADTHDFAAVWTPERHFHPFGGLFPNPSVTAAAVAAVTERVGVRAGSVVLPLHHPLRIAEEWSVVDNLSGGRAGISLASGWHPRDFILRPEAYEDRRRLTIDMIDTIRQLWRGDPYTGSDTAAGETYRVYPPPIQPELPMWLTSSGSADTIEAAGKAGVGVLTHLLGQTVDELAAKIAQYRRRFAETGRPGRGHVVLMMHTCLGEDLGTVEALVREPLQRYLMSSLNLNVNLGTPPKDGGPGEPLAEGRAKFVVERSYERYLRRDGLFGSVADARGVVERVRAADVDEIACLIDFGVPVEDTLHGLGYLNELRQSVR